MTVTKRINVTVEIENTYGADADDWSAIGKHYFGDANQQDDGWEISINAGGPSAFEALQALSDAVKEMIQAVNSTIE